MGDIVEWCQGVSFPGRYGRRTSSSTPINATTRPGRDAPERGGGFWVRHCRGGAVGSAAGQGGHRGTA